MKQLFALFSLLCLCFPVPTFAATFYVATTGNDANTCTQAQNTGSPKRNLSGSAGGLACLASGDTLYIRTGTYIERIDSALQAIASGTSWSAPTTISAYPGEDVQLRGMYLGASNAYLIINGFRFNGESAANSGLTLATGTHHIRIQNNEIY